MKLALERSEKEIIRPLDDGEKRLPSTYGGPDAAKCSNKDPRAIDDKMFQLAVVQSKKLSSRDRVLETQSLHSLYPPIDNGAEVSPFLARLGSSVLVGTDTCSASAVVSAQREGEDDSPVILSSFLAVGSGSSTLQYPRVLH